MENEGSFVGWLTVARAVHFAACLLLLSVFQFDAWLALVFRNRSGPATLTAWKPIFRKCVAIGLTLAIASGFAWFFLVASDISDQPISRAIQPGVLLRILNRTHFGRLWEIRGECLAALTVAAILLRFAAARRIGLIISLVLCASLAWTGHGQMGPHDHWHLAADVLHLLLCSVWPIGLLPFALLFYRLRGTAGAMTLANALTNPFLACVLLLIGTGLMNSYVLVGTFSNLFETPYGRVLLAKLALFALMIFIGAANRFRLLPAINRGSVDHERALQRNVLIELILGAAVVGIVGWLGQLMPGCMGM